jgi:uncharacterized protein RhaS with RHS repeats
MGIGELAVGPNLYDYVNNDPLDNTDPRGTDATAVGAGIGTIIEPGGGTAIGAGAGFVIDTLATLGLADALYHMCHHKQRDEECEKNCYDAYEDHCQNYCANLPNAKQRALCYEQALITHNICVKNCYK